MSPINWQDAANAPVEEQTGFDELPPGLWIVGATATLVNGGAAPKVSVKQFTDSERGLVRYYNFNVGLLTKGGEAGLDAKFKDRYMFFSTSVHPRDDDEQPAGPRSLLHGRLTGFLNAIFASGTAIEEKDKKLRAQARWRVTLAKLAEVEKQHPEIDGSSSINEITGQPDTGLAIMSLAIAAIENDSKMLVFKTGLSKKQQGREQRIEIKNFEDYIPHNVKERKVRLFDAEGVTLPEGVVPGF